MSSRFKQLSVDERDDIQAGLNLGLSRSGLARRLHRPPSTISRRAPSNHRIPRLWPLLLLAGIADFGECVNPLCMEPCSTPSGNEAGSFHVTLSVGQSRKGVAGGS